MQIVFAPQLAGPIRAILSRRQGAQHAPTGSLFQAGSKWGECLFWLSILGRGCSGSLAEVGPAPSLRSDPCGARFAHPPSLTPHATEANGQDWRAAGSRGAPKMAFIIGTSRNQKSLNLLGTFLATRQGERAPLPVFFFFLMCSGIRWRSIKRYKLDKTSQLGASFFFFYYIKICRHQL